MWPVLGGLISGAASLIGGIFQNNAAAAQAQQAEQFQKEQTDTAYQRGMADMKKAGLNPILAYSQGGASSAAGQQAQVTNVGDAAVRGFSEGVGSAKESMLAKAQVDNVMASTAASKASAVSSLASAKLASSNAATADALRGPLTLKAAEDATGSAYANHQTLMAMSKGKVESDYYKSLPGSVLHSLAMGGSDLAGATSAVGNLAQAQRAISLY